MSHYYDRNFSALKVRNSQFKKLAVVSAILFATVLIILILELTAIKN
jgi:hypothetical protein